MRRKIFWALPLVLAGLLISSAPNQSTAATQKTVVFVGGNSKCAEINVTADRTWSSQLSRWNDWKILGTDCFASSFYKYPKLMSIGDYAPAVAKLKPDFVVLSAGGTYTTLRSDLKFKTSYPIADELKNYRRLLPRANLIVIGPWSAAGSVPSLTKDIDKELVSATKKVSATYVSLLPNNAILKKFAVKRNPTLSFIGQTQLSLIIQSAIPARFKPTKQTALFIGDSYTYGTGTTAVTDRWSTIVAQTLNLNEVNFGIGGVGYLRSGTKFCDLEVCPNYLQLLPDLKLVNPDYVFVAGGQNDQSTYLVNPNSSKQKILDTYTAIRARFPDAKIIAVCPSQPNGDPKINQPMYFINSYVNKGADAINATKVQLMFPSVLTPQMIGPDNVHPNILGHRAIADKVLSVLAPS